MYYFMDRTDVMTGESIRQILLIEGNSCVNFPDVDSNSGPERAAYLEWVAAGNVPQPWEG